jgi:hypothetical protein
MLLCCVPIPVSVRALLLAREVSGVLGRKTLGAAVSQGTADPRMCRLSPWTLLIAAPKAVVGRLLGSVSPGTLGYMCCRSYRYGQP